MKLCRRQGAKPLKFTRRTILHSTAAALAAPLLPSLPISARAQEKVWRHGLSLFGDVKYPADFKHYDYVNPNAPKGGVIRTIAIGTFDNFNLVVQGIKGNLAAPVSLIYDSLMAASQDEASTQYGEVMETVSHPDDFASATYRLRAEARWHDGKPVTADDVIFSFDALKKNSPMFMAYYRHVTKAEKTGDREVTFTFDQPGNRELPSIVGQLYVLPKHWWEGTDASGNKRDIRNTTLELPLGSGPYRIKEFSAGRTVVLERVKDYWGAKLPVQVGQNNFDEIRYDYLRDRDVAREAFKGDRVDYMLENSAKDWSTGYDFPAARDKRVLLEEFPINSSGRMQGFTFNLRRPLFQDVRLRRAFNYAFDFEEMNKQLFYGLYKRIDSYFSGLPDFVSSGVPQGAELAILETVRDKVPSEVFTTPYVNPVGGSPENVRNNLREAARLLKEAGFEVKDRKLVDPKGSPVTVEFLTSDPASERFVLFYKPNLERLGITVNVRSVDSTQYQRRTDNFDFDIITDLWGQSLSPGNEQREFWGSTSADQQGARNTAGIKNPAVDAIVERIIFAKDRDDLVAACKALDRVLLWNFYVVPQFTSDKARYVRWDRFSHADLPKYASGGLPTLWWWDEAKAAKTGGRS
jgi:microcin C transport system substrate-binding protein